MPFFYLKFVQSFGNGLSLATMQTDSEVSRKVMNTANALTCERQSKDFLIYLTSQLPNQKLCPLS